jgi:single-strand DNA-binding protein
VNETMVTVTGNVAGDVVSRRVGANEEHLLVTFRVASSERRWDKASESWVDGDRFTASVNCWRRLAEGAMASLVKGDPVVVSGRLSVREYETEAGRRYMTEIAATAVGPDLARCSAQIRRWRPSVVEGGDGAATGENGAGVGEGTGPSATVPGSAHAAGEGSEAGGVETATAGPVGATDAGVAAGDRRRGEPSLASA